LSTTDVAFDCTAVERKRRSRIPVGTSATTVGSCVANDNATNVGKVFSLRGNILQIAAREWFHAAKEARAVACRHGVASTTRLTWVGEDLRGKEGEKKERKTADHGRNGSKLEL
jgi:hypothetical protein